MSKLLIQTQDHENYGHRWKPKGGSDFVVHNVIESEVQRIVELTRSQIEVDNEMFRSKIISAQLVADDHLTWFEQSQLDYEGSIQHPSTVIEKPDLVS
jgi:hypothetical protein